MLSKSKYHHVKVRSAKEALKHPAHDLHLPEKADVFFSPSADEMVKYFSRVPFDAFEDLQVLGFVPRNISEEKVRQAIEADNNECRQIAANATLMRTPNCQCDSRATIPSNFKNQLRSTYSAMRATHNPALARVLSDHQKTQIQWDDPLPAIVNRWVVRYDDFTLFPDHPILVAVLNDITVERDATMTLDPALDSLNAKDIWIHRQGRMVYQGSFVRIWANRLSSFIDFNIITTTTTNSPPWAITLP